MAGALLTLVIAFVGGGLLWLALGPRLRLHSDRQQNELFNLLAYAAMVLPVAFLAVFFLFERL